MPARSIGTVNATGRALEGLRAQLGTDWECAAPDDEHHVPRDAPTTNCCGGSTASADLRPAAGAVRWRGTVILAVLGVAGLTRSADDDRVSAPRPPPRPAPAQSDHHQLVADDRHHTARSDAHHTATQRPSLTRPCRNSHDPACGPFYFDPPPDPDQPMTVEVIPSASTVRVGEPMSFHVVRRDADGVLDGFRSYDLGDFTNEVEMPAKGLCDRFGAWDPPTKGLTPTVVTFDMPHTYAQPGTFTVKFSYGQTWACTDSRTGEGTGPMPAGARGRSWSPSCRDRRKPGGVPVSGR